MYIYIYTHDIILCHDFTMKIIMSQGCIFAMVTYWMICHINRDSHEAIDYTAP